MKKNYFVLSLISFFFIALIPTCIYAQESSSASSQTSNPVILLILIGLLAIAPFGLIMLTSFVKIAVVLSILRNAFGAQQIPPNHVVTGLSIILTIFIMSPVAEKMYSEAGTIQNTEAIFSEVSVKTLFEAGKKGREPLRQFLLKNTGERFRITFFNLSQQLAQKNGNDPKEITAEDFRIIIPAFVTSQLTEAFQIGFMLFIPFLIIDLVVSNILQAMGMFMLSPTAISLPFKLLLFILINGWELLLKTLILGYI